MSENRGGCNAGPANTAAANALNASNGTVCIDTYRVLDACRDRDCYEDVRIFVTEEGQEILNNSCNIRVVDTEVLWANIALSEVAFNDGFFQVNIKYYIKLGLEGCAGTGRGKNFEGLAILQKVVILFGGEGSASVFRSNGENSFCRIPDCSDVADNNLPTAVVETIDPIALSSKVVDCNCECGYCCCSCTELPDAISEFFGSQLVDTQEGNNLYVSLGLFSVIRIVRPAQILVNGTDYSVPDKECVEAEQDDPCSLFRSLAFPTSQFTGLASAETQNQRENTRRGGCCSSRS
jgi:hypothetical protein